MKAGVYKADALLFLAAVIWGAGFVAQKAAMDHMGPMTFTGVRFAIGALVLLPLAFRAHRKAGGRASSARRIATRGGLAGLVLFAGISFQQVGLVDTTAGKAGFITGLYVVFVPLLGLFMKKRAGWGTWAGAVLAAAGLYLLSVSSEFTVAPGDSLVLVGAVFWAVHVVMLGKFSPTMEPTVLACAQFGVCSALSMAVALCTETIGLSSLVDAGVPILYGGIMSVGIGYTLQVMGQRRSPSAHAAIIFSLEAVFAALAGWLILSEVMGLRGLGGCALMLGAIVLSQLTRRKPASQVEPSEMR